jgi:threonylcarbamoyladenosine tRNA methylthiotransferase MtaB
LLEALVTAVPDVRFRLSSVEATEVDERMERVMTDAPRRVAGHLHAPLQSGSDRVLKRMGRHWYTARTYGRRVERLADRIAPFGLGADVIAGFPGETEADHAATMSLIDALPFTYLHVFPYSPRPDVAAGRLREPVPPDQVRRRAADLRALGERKAAAYRAARRGARADGVVSGRHGGRLEVLTEDYLTVYYPSDAWDLRPRFEVTIA